MGGTYRSAWLPVHGPPATGRYRQKSTVGGRLRKKKGRKRRGKEEKRIGEEMRHLARALSPSAYRPSEETERLSTRGERSRG
ncbi:hypothetical protein BHM03_00019377, partial [Ensete ventricosum]